MSQGLGSLVPLSIFAILYFSLLGCGNADATSPQARFQKQLLKVREVVHQTQASTLSYLAFEGRAVVREQNQSTPIPSYLEAQGSRLCQSGDYLLQYSPRNFYGVKIFLRDKQVASIECSAPGNPMFAEYDGAVLYLGGTTRAGIFVCQYDSDGKQLAVKDFELPARKSPAPPMVFSRLVDHGLQLIAPMANLAINLSPQLEELSRSQFSLPEYLLKPEPQRIEELMTLQGQETEQRAYYQEHRGAVLLSNAKGCYFQNDSCFLIFELAVIGDYVPPQVHRGGPPSLGVYPRNEIVSISTSSYEIENITDLAKGLRFAGRQESQMAWWNSPVAVKKTGILFQVHNPVW